MEVTCFMHCAVEHYPLCTAVLLVLLYFFVCVYILHPGTWYERCCLTSAKLRYLWNVVGGFFSDLRAFFDPGSNLIGQYLPIATPIMDSGSRLSCLWRVKTCFVVY